LKAAPFLDYSHLLSRINGSMSTACFCWFTPHGGKWWRLNYRYGGRRKTISLGCYPDVSLEEARARRDEARRLLAEGVDPSAVRRERKAIETAERLAAKTACPVRVVAALDGSIELWKGRAVVRLTHDEAMAMLNLLQKITAMQVTYAPD
jgi:Arm domain-containing DNA-binding protein